MEIHSSEYWVSMQIQKGNLIQNAYHEHSYLQVCLLSFCSSHVVQFQVSVVRVSRFSIPGKETREQYLLNSSAAVYVQPHLFLILYCFLTSLFIRYSNDHRWAPLEWTASGDGELIPCYLIRKQPLLQKGFKHQVLIRLILQHFELFSGW